MNWGARESIMVRNRQKTHQTAESMRNILYRRHTHRNITRDQVVSRHLVQAEKHSNVIFAAEATSILITCFLGSKMTVCQRSSISSSSAIFESPSYSCCYCYYYFYIYLYSKSSVHKVIWVPSITRSYYLYNSYSMTSFHSQLGVNKFLQRCHLLLWVWLAMGYSRSPLTCSWGQGSERTPLGFQGTTHHAVLPAEEKDLWRFAYLTHSYDICILP